MVSFNQDDDYGVNRIRMSAVLLHNDDDDDDDDDDDWRDDLPEDVNMMMALGAIICCKTRSRAQVVHKLPSGSRPLLGTKCVKLLQAQCLLVLMALNTLFCAVRNSRKQNPS